MLTGLKWGLYQALATERIMIYEYDANKVQLDTP